MADFNPPARLAPNTVTGVRGPEDLNQARVIVDMADDIVMAMPSAQPFNTFLSKIRKTRTVTQYKYDVLFKDLMPREVELVEAALIADTSLVVVAGQGVRLKGGNLLLNPRTREVSRVTTTPAADTATVVRAWGSTERDMDAGDKLVVIGTAFEDGSGAGSMVSVQESNDYNYTQILKTDYGFTGRDLVTSLYGGKDPEVERKWQDIEHAISQEYLMLFGTRNSASGTDHLITTTGGLEYFVKNYVWDLGGDVKPTERSFTEFLEHAMKWGKGGNLRGMGTKYLFHSSAWGTEIEFWAKDRLQVQTDFAGILGLEVTKYKTTHGTVMLVRTPILDDQHPDWAFLVDLNHVRKTVLQGRNTKLVKNTQANDVDGQNEQIISDIGFECDFPDSCAIIKGLPL